MRYREQEPEGLKTSGGYVQIDGSKVNLYDPNHGRYVFSLGELAQHARRNRLPAWVREVPEITAFIDAEFVKLRECGKDPHSEIGLTEDSVFFHDLVKETRIEISFRDLRGRRLPAIFDRLAIRRQLEARGVAVS